MQTPPAHALPPRKVPASHGWQWLRQAFFLVREQPLTWVLFAVCYLLLQSLLGSLGAVGQLLTMVTVPVFAGGFVLAAARADRGETLRPLDVFAAFGSHVRQLVGLGLAYFGLLVAAMMLVVIGLLALAGGSLGDEALTAMPLGKQIVGFALLAELAGGLAVRGDAGAAAVSGFVTVRAGFAAVVAGDVRVGVRGVAGRVWQWLAAARLMVCGQHDKARRDCGGPCAFSRGLGRWAQASRRMSTCRMPPSS